ncbi:MAG: hypothetical protein Q9159_006949 [Coniocarpon cinnabarinum]
MARSASISALTDELVQIITGYSPTENAKAFEDCREDALRTLTHHRFGRTNQFNVQSSLEGLVEKLRVRNRDDVAEALGHRLKNLRLDGQGHKPEVLSLLLELSDQPVENVNLQELEHPEAVPRQPSLTWEGLEREEPLERAGLSEDIDYRLSSSDEEGKARDARRSHSGSVSTNASNAPTSAFTFDVRSLVVDVDTSALDAVENAQHWRRDIGDLLELDEVQLVRECLHSLRGLPSTLFKDTGQPGQLVPRPGILLPGCSETVVASILERTAAITSSVNHLRLHVQQRTTKPLLQALSAFAEASLDGFDRQLADAERAFFENDRNVLVSLAATLDDVEHAALFLVKLSKLTFRIQDDIWTHSFRLLDALLEETCNAQLENDEEGFKHCAKLFFVCLEVYMRPMRTWMLQGMIEEGKDAFVVTISDGRAERSSFWHARYSLRGIDNYIEAPRVLLPFIQDMFSAGKAMALIRELGLGDQLHDTSDTDKFETDLLVPQALDNIPTLLSFRQFVDGILAHWTWRMQSTTWPLLRSHVLDTCHLINHVQALHTVFLSHQGNVFDSFLQTVNNHLASASRLNVFDAAVRSTFSESPVVNTHMLSLAVDKTALIKKKGLGRIESMELTYTAPWLIANIVRPGSQTIYRQCSYLIMQLKSALNTLSALRIRPGLGPRQSYMHSWNHAALRLRHQLAYVLYTALTYITQQVIDVTHRELRGALQMAQSFDAMVAAHEAFVRTLDQGMLQIPQLRTAKDALVSICNMALVFADTVTNSAASTGAGTERGHTDRKVQQCTGQLERLIQVIVGDLRATSRNNAETTYNSWNCLADELEWKIHDAA